MCELVENSCRSATTSKAEVNFSSKSRSSTDINKSIQKTHTDQIFVEPEEGNVIAH